MDLGKEDILLNLGMKSPSLQQLDLSVFSELCGDCPLQWGLSVRFQRVTFCPNVSLDYLGGSMGTPQLTTQPL